MTNNANDKDKDTIHLLNRASKQKREMSLQREHELSAILVPLSIARQLGHRSPQMTLYYVRSSYCKQWQLKPLFKELLDRFKLEVEPDTQEEEANKEQSQTLDDEA